MGRMLDAFRQPLVRLAPPPVPAGEPATEIPFIEVGPNRSIEASPSVLEAIARSRPRPVAAPTPAPPPDPAPVTVRFQPLPPPPAPAVEKPVPPAEPFRVVFRPVGAVGTQQASGRPAAEVIAFHDPEHPASEQYRALFRTLQTSQAGGSGAAWLFTAGRSGSGTTTVLLNVAVTAARQGLRVAVVDANRARPALAARLGVPDGGGLAEVLAGLGALEASLQQTAQPGLVALPAGVLPVALDAPGRADRLRELLAVLRADFDRVFLDGPCWSGQPDAVLPAEACDAVYLVLPRDELDRPGTHHLLHHLPRQGIRLAGCLLTGN